MDQLSLTLNYVHHPLHVQLHSLSYVPMVHVLIKLLHVYQTHHVHLITLHVQMVHVLPMSMVLYAQLTLHAHVQVQCYVKMVHVKHLPHYVLLHLLALLIYQLVVLMVHAVVTCKTVHLVPSVLTLHSLYFVLINPVNPVLTSVKLLIVQQHLSDVQAGNVH
jgi:hypothetical protein